MSFDSALQRVPVSLIRLDGSVALTSHYIVDMISTHDGQYPSEHFVGSSRQIIPLSGYRDLELGDILGTASALLLCVPLGEFVPHDAHNDVTLVIVSPMPSPAPSLATNAPPDTLDEHPSELLRRFNDAQRKSIVHLWRARDLELGDILGTASALLLCVPLGEFVPHDAHNDVTLVIVSPMPSPAPSLATNAPPDTLDEHPSELLRRFNDAQRKSIVHLWRAVPFHVRRIDFALDAPSWDPSAVEALSTTRTEYADF